tara:strand:+ start:5731 stop:6543 length:813 start_codon:yes stop_codon:yes gene_type:complete
MFNLKILNIIKYQLIRLIEKSPSLNLLIYNNIRYLKFFLPHEKDYLGMKKICENKSNKVILDIGANLGISSMGFRQMGFKNKIYIFEPNPIIFKKYLLNIKKNYKNIYLRNFALGEKNKIKNFYVPYYKNNAIHYFGSFDKKYIKNSLRITFSNILSKIILKKKKIKISKFDSLNLNIRPHFIKIDVEGYDFFVLKGLSKTIKKHKPIFLIEYNKENFTQIVNFLKNYEKYIYDIRADKLVALKKKVKSRVSRNSKNNLLSNRNIYFVPR